MIREILLTVIPRNGSYAFKQVGTGSYNCCAAAWMPSINHTTTPRRPRCPHHMSQPTYHRHIAVLAHQ